MCRHLPIPNMLKATQVSTWMIRRGREVEEGAKSGGEACYDARGRHDWARKRAVHARTWVLDGRKMGQIWCYRPHHISFAKFQSDFANFQQGSPGGLIHLIS